LGVKEAPPPRVRIANMHRVYGSEAMQDPNAIEKRVRKEMAERTERHHQRNQNRKLTPAERSEKKRRKLIEDTKFSVSVAVFKVLELTTRNRHKIDRSAQLNYLTGCCINGPNFILVVVEGGPKGLKRYKKLMLRRIKWNIEDEEGTNKEKSETEPIPENQEAEPNKSNHPPTETVTKMDETEPNETTKKIENRCDLIWEGEVRFAAFNDFQMRPYQTSELLIRKFLTDRGCVHYWDLAKNFIPTTT